ncbi:MAG: hypothetical protein ACYDG6_14425 [Thermincolia bacterium]
MNKNLDKLMQDIDNKDSKNPELYLSSNPYDYIKDNPHYNEIIKIGYDALPVLEDELKKTNASGLREYILSIAIEEITKSDLKQFESYQWDRAENFKLKWNQYLKDIPTNVEKIIKSDNPPKKKEKEIEKLGATAVPYVVQYAESIDQETNSEMASILSKMVTNGNVSKTVDEFNNKNKDTIQKLQKYVETR